MLVVYGAHFALALGVTFPTAMPTKGGRVIKTLRKMVAEFPPENYAPWKEPNNALRKVISKSERLKLEETLQEVQEGILKNCIEKIKRSMY